MFRSARRAPKSKDDADALPPGSRPEHDMLHRLKPKSGARSRAPLFIDCENAAPTFRGYQRANTGEPGVAQDDYPPCDPRAHSVECRGFRASSKFDVAVARMNAHILVRKRSELILRETEKFDAYSRLYERQQEEKNQMCTPLLRLKLLNLADVQMGTFELMRSMVEQGRDGISK